MVLVVLLQIGANDLTVIGTLPKKTSFNLGNFQNRSDPLPHPQNFGTFGALLRKPKLNELLGHCCVS